jgi:hypothetical protein
MYMSALFMLAITPEFRNTMQVILDTVGILGLLVIVYLLFLAVLALPDLLRYIRMKMM